MRKTTVQERISPQWLLGRGWYIAEAAREINRTPSHVRRVLIGDRKSKAIEDALRALPEKELTKQRG